MNRRILKLFVPLLAAMLACVVLVRMDSRRDQAAKRARYEALVPGVHESEVIQVFGQPYAVDLLPPAVAVGDLRYDPGGPVRTKGWQCDEFFFSLWIDDAGTILRVGNRGEVGRTRFWDSFTRLLP